MTAPTDGDDLARRIGAAADLRQLLGLWHDRHHDPTPWARSPQPARMLAERLLNFAALGAALEVIVEELETHRGDVRLRQLWALALAGSGETEPANSLLRLLELDGHLD